jgi:hypothetical protein
MELGAHRDAGHDRAVAGAHGDRSALSVDRATVGSISLTLVRVALLGLWLWYLLCCPVRDAFHQSRDIKEQQRSYRKSIRRSA